MFASRVLDQQVAIVTGGGTGIGLAIGRALGRLGARVVVASRSAEHLEAGFVVPLAIAATVIGLGLGFVVFRTLAPKLPALKRPFRALEAACAHKFWFDELYDLVIVRPADALAGLFRAIDGRFVDGLVNAVGRGGVRTGDVSGAHDRVVVDGLVRFTGALCQTLGAALLAAGEAGEAATVYREELRRNLNNVWSLKGLALSLKARQGSAEAMEVERQLGIAGQFADVTMTASRF